MGLMLWALLLGLFLGSGFTTVPPNSIGYGRLFGEVYWRDLQPGLHYLAPRPFVKVDKWPVREVKSILIVGAYAANAEIINLAHSLGDRYIMANLSFVLSYELKKRIDAPNDRILVSEVMPNANDTSMQVVRNFHRALAAGEDRQQAALIAKGGNPGHRLRVAPEKFQWANACCGVPAVSRKQVRICNPPKVRHYC